MPNSTLEHRTGQELSSGSHYPRGATLRDEGVNFALFSQNAAEVYLLLFDEPDASPTDVIRMECRTQHVWHVFVHGVRAGQLYAYKVRGDYRPAHGLRFNER